MADWITSTLEDGALPGAGTGRFEAVRFGDWARLSSGLTQRKGHKVSRSEGRRRIVVCCGWLALTSTRPENFFLFDEILRSTTGPCLSQIGFLRHESGSEIGFSRKAKGEAFDLPCWRRYFVALVRVIPWRVAPQQSPPLFHWTSSE